MTERDEFTVMHRTASPDIKFPISGAEIKDLPKAKEYLSMHEKNEVTEFDEVYYLAKQD